MTATNGPETARKAPARRAPAKPKADPTPPPAPDDAAETVAADALEITTTPRKAGRRVVIFYVDGKPYSVPESPPANVSLNYANEVRRWGPLVASTYLLEVMLGSEGYDVLRSQMDLTDEQLAQVMEKVQAQLAKGPKE
jgi:hypothetical protein